MGGVHEECGVFGLYARKNLPAADLVMGGLLALQHRGQESCGIVVNDDGVFFSRKDLGLLSQVFSPGGAGPISQGSHGGGPCEVRHYRGRKSRQLPTH